MFLQGSGARAHDRRHGHEQNNNNTFWRGKSNMRHREVIRARASVRKRAGTLTLQKMFLLMMIMAMGVLGGGMGWRIVGATPDSSVAAPKPRLQIDSENNSDQGVKVYVYDDPLFDQSDLIQCYRDQYNGVSPWQDERADMAQDMGEIWLHQALLVHKWRVLNPEDADVFFVPLYPVLSYKLLVVNDRKCGGRTHGERISAVFTHLDHESTYFKRFGGADHVMICAWWNCRNALSRVHRMLMRRAVIGVNEAIKAWSNWGCGGKMVTVPYTASSIVTTDEMVGGRGDGERNIPFFFAGTARHRVERENLAVAKTLYPDSVIELGENGHLWSENATVYADKITHSRFCFCPRGDTESSRRLFDAVAAGCIPVLSTTGARFLPFRTGLNYSDFAVVTPLPSFTSEEGVLALVDELSSRSDEEIASLQRGLQVGRDSVVYGVTTGPRLSDMHPSTDVASRFLQETKTHMTSENLWSCPPVGLNRKKLAPRTWGALPPPDKKREFWLVESETIINKEHRVLFCAPPNTGSMQFRMLAKRMQGSDHWAAANNASLLFDPATSELPLLNATDGDLMTKIYADNGSGWIKIGVVRDPVTRLLSVYLDLVYGGGVDGSWYQAALPLRANNSNNSSSNNDSNTDGGRHRHLRREDTRNVKRHGRGRGRRRRQEKVEGALGDGVAGEEETDKRVRDEQVVESQSEAEGEWEGRVDGPEMETADQEDDKRLSARDSRDERVETGEGASLEGGGDEPTDTVDQEDEKRGSARDWRREEPREGSDDADDVVPTFEQLVNALETSLSEAPTAFRPLSTLCGMRQSPFDTIVPFETLQKTSTEVLKSLPDGVWDTYGASGWGPDGDRAFMEFDYGSVMSSSIRDKESLSTPSVPRRARDLFEGDSCGWTKYYSDRSILDKVRRLYAGDYDLFGWYDLDPWMERWDACVLL